MSTASGTTIGSGRYQTGSEVTVSVVPTGEHTFHGWYNAAAQRVSSELSYTFTATGDTTLYALFQEEYFVDVARNAWYYHEANRAGQAGVINGIRPFEFSADETVTRAMAITILGRAVKADMPSGETAFSDVNPEAWYAGAVLWAREHEIVFGITEDQYAPNDSVTREQFISMLMRLLDDMGQTPELSALEFEDVDKISAYAVEEMQKAATLGLIEGYADGTLRPQNKLTRAEAVTLVLRLVDWLAEAEAL